MFIKHIVFLYCYFRSSDENGRYSVVAHTMNSLYDTVDLEIMTVSNKRLISSPDLYDSDAHIKKKSLKM